MKPSIAITPTRVGLIRTGGPTNFDHEGQVTSKCPIQKSMLGRDFSEILQVFGMVNYLGKNTVYCKDIYAKSTISPPPQLWRSTFSQHTFLCRPPKLPSVLFCWKPRSEFWAFLVTGLSRQVQEIQKQFSRPWWFELGRIPGIPGLAYFSANLFHP